MVANSLSVPVPFSGGNTSNEKCLSFLFLLSSSITVISFLICAFGDKITKKKSFPPLFLQKSEEKFVFLIKHKDTEAQSFYISQYLNNTSINNSLCLCISVFNKSPTFTSQWCKDGMSLAG